MRHQTKKNTLGKAQDQRKALLRSLATELFVHGEIKTTMARAKALQPYAENVITMAKKGDLNSRRLAGRYGYGHLCDCPAGRRKHRPPLRKRRLLSGGCGGSKYPHPC